MKQVGGINLLGGRLDIKDQSANYKNSFYLLYRGNNLLYLSSEKQIWNKDFIYHVHKWQDSLYMLTRKSQFRYLFEDTILFHSDYVVANRCVYGRTPMGELEIIDAFFNSYHLTIDSVNKFSFHSRKPVISIQQYGRVQNVTEKFISEDSKQTKLPRREMAFLMKEILR